MFRNLKIGVRIPVAAALAHAYTNGNANGRDHGVLTEQSVRF
ncbi:MAG TPA: hypothetical protein VNQ81_06090 [Povalibacter sp.]|nr:hypothetical protein [Povalibacter sp.]